MWSVSVKNMYESDTEVRRLGDSPCFRWFVDANQWRYCVCGENGDMNIHYMTEKPQDTDRTRSRFHRRGKS